VADTNTIWLHPLGVVKVLPIGSYVKLTCRDECHAEAGDAWTQENEDDHEAVWRVVVNTNGVCSLEIPEKGRSTWAHAECVEMVKESDAFGSGEVIPVMAAPVHLRQPGDSGGTT